MPTQPYFVDGKRVPGTTTVYSKRKDPGGLLIWANQEGLAGRNISEKSEEAKLAGNVCHEMIRAWLHREEFQSQEIEESVAKAAEQGFESFMEWRGGRETEILAAEAPLVSRAHLYGGTPDLIERSKGRVELSDWKVAKGLYIDYLVQVAAYCNLWDENHPDMPVERVHLLRFGKESASFTHQSYPREDLAAAWRAFLLLREVYELDKQLAKMLR